MRNPLFKNTAPYAQGEVIEEIFRTCQKIAIVGVSDKPYRDSYRVAQFMKEMGYQIIPVNPNVSEVLGEKSYPDILSIPGQIDLVDIFRRPEFVEPIVDQAIQKKVKAIWMQLGVVNEKAAKKAQQAGLLVVMNRCWKIEYMNRYNHTSQNWSVGIPKSD